MDHPPHSASLRLHRQSLPALITICSARREVLFARSDCVSIVLDSLHWLESHQRMILCAAVVMPDHVHFVADPLGVEWASHLHLMKSHTGRLINRQLRRCGAVWQRQYHDRAVHTDDHLIAAIRYCELNPARAGLVSEAGGYPHFWSRFQS